MKNKFMLISALLVFSLTACSSGKKDKEKEKDKTTNEQKVGSSDKKPEKPSKEIEPEELLSKEEVEAVTGLSVEKVKKLEEEAVGQKIAAYHLKKGGLLQISMNHMSADKIKMLYDGLKDMNKDNVVIEGLCDEAFKASALNLYVRKKDYIINIIAPQEDMGLSAIKIALKNLENIIGK